MDNRNRDRGTIKWTSLMLPEHVEMIKQVWKEDERVEKPILDEQQLEEIGFKLQQSMRDHLPLEVTYHNGFDLSTMKVKVMKIDPYTQKVSFTEIKGERRITLEFNKITDVYIV